VLGRQAGAAAARSCAEQPLAIPLNHSVAAVQLQTQPLQRLAAAAAGRAVRCKCSSTPQNAEPVPPLVVVEGVSGTDWNLERQCCRCQPRQRDPVQPLSQNACCYTWPIGHCMYSTDGTVTTTAAWVSMKTPSATSICTA
jgi:hypothetical protein